MSFLKALKRWETIGLLVVLFPFLLNSPLYTDELAWKWLNSRLWWDSGVSISLYPQCSETFSVQTPVLFLPARLINALIFGHPMHLIFFRVLGILGWGLWLGSLVALGNRLSIEPKKTFSLGLFLTSLGVMPFVMSLNRPEQILLLCLTCAISFPLFGLSTKPKRFLGGSAFIFLASVFFAQHVKALFFLPLWLVILMFLRVSSKMKFLLSSFLMVLSGACFWFFAQITKCSNEPLKMAFDAMLISPTSIQNNTKESLHQMLANGLHFSQYWNGVLFQNRYFLDWLPENYGFAFGAKILNGAVFGFYGVFFMFLLLQWGKTAGKSFREPKGNYSFWASSALLVALLSLGVLQTSKSFYESALVIPVGVIGGLLLLTESQKNLVLKVSAGLAVVSVLFLGFRFEKPLRDSWLKKEPLVNQDHSINAWYQNRLGGTIAELSKTCGLDQQKKHLILDDLTYPFFMKSKEPYHAIYVMGWWGRMSHSDNEAFFRQREVGGILSHCRWWPEELLKKAIKKDDLCCLGYP